MSKMADTKALSEVKALEMFYNALQADPDRAYYGINHVEKANEAQAIEILLITDSLFRYVFFYVIYWAFNCVKCIYIIDVMTLKKENGTSV